MKLCIAGKNNIAVDILLHALKYFPKDNICVVINKTDNFKNTWQKSLGFYARQLEIQILQLKDLQENEDLVFISLEFDRIIRPSRFKSKNLYNIHFSYLPEYKGMFTSLLPILHGKEYSGVTLHRIDSGIDTGEIIAQKKFTIEDFTCSDLYYRYLKEGTELVKKYFQSLISNDIVSEKQSLIGSTYFSKNSFDFAKREIDIRQTSFQIQLQVNGLYFRPYQLATFNGYKICKAAILNQSSNQKTGTILDENEAYFEVQSIDSCIRLYKDYYDDLLEAIRKEQNEQIRYYSELISKNSDINEFNGHGWNPMIIACYTGSIHSVKTIHKFGGNIHAKNLNGTTTLMYAKSAFETTKDLKVIKYLLDNGAKVKSKDVFGKTIFNYTNDTHLIDLLKQYD